MSLGQNQPPIFICDDQIDVREALRLLLKSNGFRVETFDGPASLLDAAAHRPASIILLDMNYTRDTTSGAEGLDLIHRLRELRVPAALIAMTAWGDISLAVEAMQRGASDFIEKPWNNDRLLRIIAKWSAVPIAVPTESKEIASARRVQQNLLPKQQGARLGPVDSACRFLPAREVSGDYYDFFEKQDGHFGFVVADVSGKGVPAAMLMANLQGLFRSHVRDSQSSPSQILKAVNAQFHESTSPESYATAFYADFDANSRQLSYVNCGHPAGFLRRSSGELEQLASSALVIGAFPFWQAEPETVTMNPGDRLLIYSDGAVEAQSDNGEEFGEDRLSQLFESTASLPPADALNTLEAAIQEHSGVSLFDDCTLLLASVR